MASASAPVRTRPNVAPTKATSPLRPSPATRKMMTAVRTVTTQRLTSSGSHPFKNSGITSFQTASAVNRKLKSA